MTRAVRFTISGHAAETDAPTVEDVLDQMRDFLDILRGVEEAAVGAPGSAIEWRVVHASRSSPLALEIQPFPKQFATNIDARVEIVVAETARGLAALQYRAERPRHFTNDVMRKAQRAFKRVTNGISASGADFGPGLPKIDLTRSVARNAAQNVETVLASPDKPYQEIGSIEGYFQGVEMDGYGRRVAHVMDRISGEPIKCVIARDAKAAIHDLASREIRDVWRYMRVLVHGRIFFNGPGKVDHVDAEGFRFFATRDDLPQINDIIDPDFTNGMRSEEYLERLRDGTLS